MSVEASVQCVVDALTRNGVRALLMGGQACVAHGASEFTRDVDLAVLAEERNIASLKAALDELGAHVIAVPPFERQVLERGHAVHFRCTAPKVEGLRVDVMSRMRGVEPFDRLWDRRVELDGGLAILGLPDLIAAKKTQRDKDWPMIRRLIEADYFSWRANPPDDRIELWLHECRTPTILVDIVARYPSEASQCARPAVRAACEHAHETHIQRMLDDEAAIERRADSAYWAPLRQELEAMRLARRRSPP